jgi:hypothetical protein
MVWRAHNPVSSTGQVNVNDYALPAFTGSPSGQNNHRVIRACINPLAQI